VGERSRVSGKRNPRAIRIHDILSHVVAAEQRAFCRPNGACQSLFGPTVGCACAYGAALAQGWNP